MTVAVTLNFTREAHPVRIELDLPPNFSDDRLEWELYRKTFLLEGVRVETLQQVRSMIARGDKGA